MKARLLGQLNGKKVYEFPVEISLNKGIFGNVDDWVNPGKLRQDVIAYTASAAADFVREQFEQRPETEITVYGPKGGRAAYRFIGFYSAIGNSLLYSERLRQLSLAFQE